MTAMPPTPVTTTTKKSISDFTAQEIDECYKAIEAFKVKGQKFKYLIPMKIKSNIEKDAEIKIFIDHLMMIGEGAWGRAMSRAERREKNDKIKKLW